MNNFSVIKEFMANEFGKQKVSIVVYLFVFFSKFLNLGNFAWWIETVHEGANQNWGGCQTEAIDQTQWRRSHHSGGVQRPQGQIRDFVGREWEDAANIGNCKNV